MTKIGVPYVKFVLDNAHVKWIAMWKFYKSNVYIVVIEDLVCKYFQGVYQHQQDHPKTHTFVVAIQTQNPPMGLDLHNTMKDVGI